RVRRRRWCGVELRQVEIAERDLACDRVSKLAHVAGPPVVRPSVEDARGRSTALAAERLPEMTSEELDVPSAFAQRRKLDARDDQTMEQIVAEASVLHL